MISVYLLLDYLVSYGQFGMLTSAVRMAVKMVQNELLIQYLIYGYSVQISILSFQHENCKRMPPLAFKS